jgi:arylsulfatase
MNNFTERTWVMVQMEAKIKALMETYIKYPPRKLQSMGYDGPIELSKYQKFMYIREQLEKNGFNIPLPSGN